MASPPIASTGIEMIDERISLLQTRPANNLLSCHFQAPTKKKMKLKVMT